jgi:hypothetical protein
LQVQSGGLSGDGQREKANIEASWDVSRGVFVWGFVSDSSTLR